MSNLSIHSFLSKARNYLQQKKPSGIPNWSPNTDFSIKPLGQGEYNMNFLVQQGETAWVLRINTGSQIGLNLSEQIAYEFKTLKLLEPADVSPKPYFLDDTLEILPYGALGMSYLPGEKLDYKRDLKDAARLMANYHKINVPNENNHLIVEKQPLTLTYQRCLRMMEVYINSELVDPDYRSYLIEVRDWADHARHREVYFQQDPWNCIINTEVNNTNWIVNRQHGTLYLTDWEKPLWGDPSQDLSHFRVPTTTLWKTEYRMSDSDKEMMMSAYKDSIEDPHLADTIEERTCLRDPFNCLRGISWCAMAWVQYQRDEHLLKNPDTYRKLSMYVDLDFIRGLFDPYMKLA